MAKWNDGTNWNSGVKWNAGVEVLKLLRTTGKRIQSIFRTKNTQTETR